MKSFSEFILTELSKPTMRSYMAKANDSAAKQDDVIDRHGQNSAKGRAAMKKYNKREDGVRRALKKLSNRV